MHVLPVRTIAVQRSAPSCSTDVITLRLAVYLCMPLKGPHTMCSPSVSLLMDHRTLIYLRCGRIELRSIAPCIAPSLTFVIGRTRFSGQCVYLDHGFYNQTTFASGASPGSITTLQITENVVPYVLFISPAGARHQNQPWPTLTNRVGVGQGYIQYTFSVLTERLKVELAYFSNLFVVQGTISTPALKLVAPSHTRLRPPGQCNIGSLLPATCYQAPTSRERNHAS